MAPGARLPAVEEFRVQRSGFRNADARRGDRSGTRNSKLGTVVALLLLGGCGGSDAPSGVAFEEDHFATTADGWTIALHRSVPATTKFAEPVLLTHGFIENRRIWDLDADHSLVRVLVERGFEVWTMELRGSGASQAPPLTDLKGWTFGIDDFVKYDAPAAIAKVLAVTGASQILMVGHSLGGLIAYATLEGPLAPKVRAAVTLAGAGTMSGGLALKLAFNNFFALLGVTLGPILPSDAPFPAGFALHAALGESETAWAALGSLLDSPLGRPVWHEGNMTPALVEKLLRDAVTNTSLNVVKQFLAYASAGKVAGVTDKLPLIATPVLALAGAEDLIIPAANVKLVASKCGAEYVEVPGVGHEDICVGVKSPTLVYPLVADWLVARATKSF